MLERVGHHKVIALKIQLVQSPNTEGNVSTPGDISTWVSSTWRARQGQGPRWLSLAGWDNGSARWEERLVTVDLFQPGPLPIWPTLTLTRDFPARQSSFSETCVRPTHLWIQTNEPPQVMLWTVLKLDPHS